MPSYAWLKNRKLNPESIKRHMDVLGFPYTDEEISALREKTELDALVAYIQSIGRAVVRKPVIKTAMKRTLREEYLVNPFAGDPEAITKGMELYEENCAMCHGEKGEGDIGPSLIDNVFLYVEGDLPDDDYFEIINNGTSEGMVEEGRTAKGGMPPFGEELQKDEKWYIISYIRSLQGKK